MKRFFLALAVLSSVALATVPQASSQVPGPGDKGATLKQPWLETPPNSPPTSSQTPSYLQNLLDSKGPGQAPTGPVVPTSLQPYDTTGLNNDILATPEVGPWMILVASYRGPDGPMRARQMVSVLRTHYKLPTYVFNFGAEEKRKELARITKLIEEQKAKLKEELKEHNLSAEEINQPIRVRHEKIDEYCGVLVGGYPTLEAASAARNNMRKVQIDPKLFTLQTPGDLLDTKFYVADTDAKGKKGEQKSEIAFISPFMRAMPVHNPTSKVERPADAGKLDVAALKHMNSEEEYSLFRCPKNYTLAIKQFHMPAQAMPRSEPAFFDGFGLGKKASNQNDFAAENAHKFAEALRKSKLEAYVLHMKYYSLVTVGGFDSMDDANLRSMQQLLETRLMVPSLDSLQLFPKAMPMQIPR
jgi:hypothetical protein